MYETRKTRERSGEIGRDIIERALLWNMRRGKGMGSDAHLAIASELRASSRQQLPCA